MTARQKIPVGIGHAGRTVAVEEADTTFLVYGGAQLLTEVEGRALASRWRELGAGQRWC